jgi:hypothetical protein
MDLSLLTDEQLESRLESLVANERETTIEVIACLAEMHRRHLAKRRGYSGLFLYCTKKLRYTPDEAMRRINAARLGAKWPEVLDKLSAGDLSVTAVRVLSPVLTEKNHRDILAEAVGKPIHQVELLAASLNPQPDKRDHIQVLSAPPPASSENPAPMDELPLFATALQTPMTLKETRVHFGFTGSEELLKKLERAKQLLWHSFPEGRLEDIVSAALDDLLDKRDPERQKEPRKPKLSKEDEERHRRYIPRWVRAEAWKKCGGRCAFTTSDGVRCEEPSGLEYDHIVPFALGGASDDPDNIRLLCRAHNQLSAKETFGDAAVRSGAPGATTN